MILGRADKDYVARLEDKVQALEGKLSDKIKECSKQRQRANTFENDLSVLREENEMLKSKLAEIDLKDLVKEHIDFDKFVKDNEIEYQQLAKYLGVSISTLSVYRRNPEKIPDKRYLDIKDKLNTYHKGSTIIKG